MQAVHFILLLLVACLLGVAVGMLLGNSGFSGGAEKKKKRGRPSILPKADAYDTPKAETKRLLMNASEVREQSGLVLYPDPDLDDALEVLRQVEASEDSFSPDVIRRAKNVAELRRSAFSE